MLGREPDTAGRDFWVTSLVNGLSRADALLTFTESPEHRDLTAAVVDRGYFDTDETFQSVALIYDAALGRAPDAAGLEYWAGQIKSGSATSTSVADAFAASGEFQAATAGLSNAGLVDFVYRNVLDRSADAGGQAFWTQQLDNGLGRGQLLFEFAQSAEHYALYFPRIDQGIDFI